MSKLPTQSQIDKLELEGTKQKELKNLKSILKDGSRSQICNDPPSNAQKYDVQLSLGDVIITATDGVFDNLFNKEVLEIIKAYKLERYSEKREQNTGLIGPPCFLSHQEEAKELARRICRAARAKVDDGEANKRVETPYQRLFKKTYNSVWQVSVHI